MKITQVDAFTDQPFAGNPAAVCILPAAVDAGWMQNVAREMNLSETAFLMARKDGYDLRWFTPAVEVALCGHATLASAHVLYSTGLLGESEMARFHTLSGILEARRNGEWIELDFPALPPEPCAAPEGLLEALGVADAKYVGRSRFDYLIEVDDVRTLRPDFARFPVDARGVIVTCGGDTRFHFHSRYFAPAAGINEDPVTGSAHCVLAPYWSQKLGRREMTGYQASERGGVVGVRLPESDAADRLILRGQAVTTLVGELVAGADQV